MARWRRVRRLAAVIPAVVLAAQAVAAQSPAARVDSLFAFAGDSTPGCAVGVYRDGTILFSRGYGMADLENDVRIIPTSTATYLFDSCVVRAAVSSR
jgi:CubicO group peptidase (beta-lactamase class C family)